MVSEFFTDDNILIGVRIRELQPGATVAYSVVHGMLEPHYYASLTFFGRECRLFCSSTEAARSSDT
jgi:hypothetical protein